MCVSTAYMIRNIHINSILSFQFFVNIGHCVNYKNITEKWRKIGSPYRHNCDRNKKAMDGINWHRFVEPAGLMLPSPSDRPKLFKTGKACGAPYVARMEGDHPNIDDGIVTRRVCFSHGTAWYNNACLQIKVAECDDQHGEVFYVYQLKNPKACNFAYCAL